MANKPDFIVDPSGNVRDVRGQKGNSTTPSVSSQNAGSGASSGGSGGVGHETRGSISRNPGTPGGVIIIPIGLILSLIFLLFRMAAGAGTSTQNRYSEFGVNSLNLGLSYYEQGDYENAILHFNLAIAEEPGMSEAYNDRGLAYAAIEENNKALADFDKAIELDPSSAGSYSNRGTLYLSLGNHEQSLADLNKAIELSPKLAKAYHNRGLTYLDLGELDKAIADFDKAIEMTPEAMFAAQATMESRSAAVQSPMGINFTRGLMNRDDYADLPFTYAARAIAYLQKGDNEKAGADLEKATALGLDPLFAFQIGAQIPVTPLLPQAGRWEGTSYHSGYHGTVSFDIGEDGQIHDFQLDLPFGADDSCLVTSEDIWPQLDGTFSFDFATASIETGVIVQGKFETSTIVTGDFIQQIKCLSTTGELHDGYLSGGASWKAEWITGPEEIANPTVEYEQPVITDAYGVVSIDVSSLAIDPVTPSTLYAGTPRGVFKSTNGGEQWSETIEGMSYAYVNVLAIDPSAPETLYAGTSLGMFKSTDAAATWMSVARDLFSFTNTLSLVIDPQTPNILYAGTLTGVFKTTDGGLNWSESSSGLGSVLVYSLAIDPSTTNTLYAGTPNGVFKSSDGGESWLAINNGLLKGYVQVLTVDPHTPSTLYAGTQNGLFKSADGGANWSRSFWAEPVVTIALSPTSPSEIYIGRSDGLFTSADGGTNWSVIYGNGKPIRINVVLIDPLTPGALYAGTSEGLFRVTESGANWIPLQNGLPQ